MHTELSCFGLKDDASILEPKVGGMHHCILVCIHVEFVVRSRAFARRLQVRCFGHVYLKKDQLQDGSCRSKRGASSSELMGCQKNASGSFFLI